MMKKIILPSLLLMALPFIGLSQCTTTNATTCVCENSGSTNCDLLPDIIVARPPLLVSGTSGIIEYSQSGNGANDGRLRLSVSTPNIGHGPLEVRTTNRYVCGTDTITGTAPATCPNTGLPPKQLVVQRVYKKNGNTMSYIDRNAGSMTYHPSHGHMHVDDWGIYTLRTQTNDPNPLNWPIVATGAKLAFCLMDYGSCTTYSGHCVDANGSTLLNGNFPNYGLGGGAYNCSPTVQGISSGYTDIYYQSLDGMWINIPPGTCNGTYQIVVQLDPYNYFEEENENNNILVVPYTLTQQVSSASASITSNRVGPICSSDNVTLTANSGGGYTYLWNTGATTQSISVNTPGNYVVTVTSPCGVATSSPYTVSVLGTNPVTTNATICGPGVAQLNATANGASIKWFDAASGGNQVGTGNTLNLPSVGATSTYYAEATNTITGFSGFAQPTNNTIGTGAYFTGSQYQIFDVLQNLTLASVKVYAQTATSTTVELRNSAGTLLNSLTASIPAGASRITLNWNIPAGTDYRLTRSGTASLYRNSAGVVYPYTIPNYLSIKNSSAGTAFYYFFYDWEVTTPSTTCTSLRVPAVVTVNNIPSISITGNNTICAGDIATLNAGGAVSYNWSPSTGLNATNVASVNANPAATTTYTITGTDANGCTGSNTVTVNVNPLPVVTANTDVVLCAGNTTTLTATGATAYSWSPTTGLSASNGSSVNANPAATTTYTVTGTDGNGCAATDEVTVTVNPLPVVTASADVVLCAGNITTLSATGATAYNWSPATSLSASNGSSVNANPAATTTYTVTGSDDNGCAATDEVTVTVNPLPVVTASADVTLCAGNTTTLTATGATTYSWSPTTGLSASNGSSVNANPAATTTYTVTGTDGNGCAATDEVTVTVNPLPNVTLAGFSAVCSNAAAFTLNGGAPAGGTFSGPGVTANTFNPAVAGVGTHTITYAYTDIFGCSAAASKTIVVNNCNCITPGTPGPIAGAAKICAGATVNYTINNNPNVTTYTWSVPATATIVSGQGTNSVNILFGANYVSGSVCVVATNACGTSPARCKTIAKTASTTPANIVGELSGLCVTNANFSVPAIAGTVSYNWTVPAGVTITGGQGTNAISVSTATGFVSGPVCVTANNGCVNSTSRCATIYSAPAKPTVISGPATVCAGQSNVTYTVAPVYGATTYTWSVPAGSTIVSGQNTNTIVVNFGTTTGKVGVTAKNACGNRGTTTLSITFNCRLSLATAFSISANPNPSSGKTEIVIDGTISENSSLIVTNVLGKDVYTQKVNTSAGNVIPLDLTGFAKGIYLITLQSGELQKSIRLVVN